MVVFKYIEDKDVFQKFYSKMLAKRLVQVGLTVFSTINCSHFPLLGLWHILQIAKR